MKTIQLLDCTLRDGGFVNDWKFGFGSIKSIISRLDTSKIDIIEVGLLDERRNYDRDRSIFPNTKSISPVFENLNIKNSMIVGMIDFGTCSIDKIEDKNISCLDGIRVIFKKEKQDEALDLLLKIKDKGYKIFVNPVSITSYSEDEIISLIKKINKLDPYAVSIVDTYGLLHSKDLIYYFNIFDKNLKEEVVLGYHAHNNFQMAYANSITLMENSRDRNIIIDSSLYGMGKSAGNANTELVAMYMNENFDKKFDIFQIQEAIDVDIMKEYYKKFWGYNFFYYIAALNDCHPSYVQFFLDKKTLSVKSVNEILKNIPNEKRLSYDEKLSLNLLEIYQNKNFDDTQVLDKLKTIFDNKHVLLLGPGRSIFDIKNYSNIERFIGDKNPIIVSVNFLENKFPIDYVFMGNAKRFSQFFHQIYGNDKKIKTICTSNITETGKSIDYVVNYENLISNEEEISDNPLVLFLNLLLKINVKSINLAGFDGYIPIEQNNYYDEYIPLLYCKPNLLLRNECIKKFLSAYQKKEILNFLTKSLYVEG